MFGYLLWTVVMTKRAVEGNDNIHMLAGCACTKIDDIPRWSATYVTMSVFNTWWSVFWVCFSWCWVPPLVILLLLSMFLFRSGCCLYHSLICCFCYHDCIYYIAVWFLVFLLMPGFPLLLVLSMFLLVFCWCRVSRCYWCGPCSFLASCCYYLLTYTICHTAFNIIVFSLPLFFWC